MRHDPLPTKTLTCVWALCAISQISIFASEQPASPSPMSIVQQSFGSDSQGQPVQRFLLTNDQGMQVGLIDLGGSLSSLIVPDHQGQSDDLIFGFDTLEPYKRGNYGAITGRYANRIANARFTLDGQAVRVTQNSGPHHIHGGHRNFSRVHWDAQPFCDKDRLSVTFSYLSKDGEEGFPGNLHCQVTYSLTRDNALRIDYRATTDKPTVLNLTNHAYFNLAGAGNGTIDQQVLHIKASQYTVVDTALIPTGEIRSVTGTSLDFQSPKPFAPSLHQLPQTGGFDHNFIFDDWNGQLKHVATAYDPESGRVMDLLTTEPGMQLYTANHFNNRPGRDGKTYPKHGAFCFETQHFPDAPNHPHFPSTTLHPGQVFESTTIFRFSIR